MNIELEVFSLRFYDALQLDPAVLKPKIQAAKTMKERWQLWGILALRSLLIVLFAILFIGTLSNVFGAENSAMAVALFCILLGIRFVDFGYCIGDSMVTLALSFLLLLTAPVAASLLHPLFAVLLHFAAFFALSLMTCEKPEMGNGGLYSFAYIFLTGNPVTGEMFEKRCWMTLFGYLLCGTILFCKHREKNRGVRFRQVLKTFRLSREKCRWQLRMALGVSLALSLGCLFHLERFMWMGFACGSLLSSYPYTSDVKERSWYRMLGVVTGSGLFFVIYLLLPPKLHPLMGPLGGLCLGFCTDYRYKSAINCFGALMLAAGLYGIHGAVLLRVFNNLLGVLLGFVFVRLYQVLVDRHFENTEKRTG